MTVKLVLLVALHYEMILIISSSIAGVTYRDDFDFEDRYRDVNECNPFYWHPLHLPDYCAHIFEKLIRSRLAKKTPVRIMRKREKVKKEKDAVYSLDTKQTRFGFPETRVGFSETRYGFPDNNYQFPFPIYQMSSLEYESEYSSPGHSKSRHHRHKVSPYGDPLPLTPYEKLLQLLKEDIKNGPSSPTVTVMPNLGPVALYNQAISKKSMNLIRQMAEAYVKETKKMYEEYYAAYGNYPSEPQLYVYDSAKNKTQTDEDKKKKDKKDKKKKEKKDKNKVYRLKTKHGGVVTVIETKNLEVMKKDGFMP